jgi:hypothetical protein
VTLILAFCLFLAVFRLCLWKYPYFIRSGMSSLPQFVPDQASCQVETPLPPSPYFDFSSFRSPFKRISTQFPDRARRTPSPTLASLVLDDNDSDISNGSGMALPAKDYPEMPVELLHLIFQMCEPKTLGTLMQCSKLFDSILRNEVRVAKYSYLSN